jgi:hypothetical protein
MRAGDQEVMFDRQQVKTIYERGDSVRNGRNIGFFVGAALGVAAGAFGSECGGFFESARSCTADEKVRLGLVGGGLFGLVGLGLGAGVDAMIVGRRLLYEQPGRIGVRSIAVEPSVAASGTRLLLSVAW